MYFPEAEGSRINVTMLPSEMLHCRLYIYDVYHMAGMGKMIEGDPCTVMVNVVH